MAGVDGTSFERSMIRPWPGLAFTQPDWDTQILATRRDNSKVFSN
jgi:hypothetical protein